MPKKSAINRGAFKLTKLYNKIYTTIKAQNPNVPDEYAMFMALEGVAKYAEAVGFYEGVWRGFKAYLLSKVSVGTFRQIAGPVRSVVLHIARLLMNGASDDEIEKTIDSASLPQDIRDALKAYFIGAGTQKAKS